MAEIICDLAQRQDGEWVILPRTGRKAVYVATGHVDRSLAEFEREHYARYQRLSPTGLGWLRVAQHLASRANCGRSSRQRRKKVVGSAKPITAKDMLRLLKKQQYRCAVSGSYFTPEDFKPGPKTRHPFQPSVDRIDSSLGYALNNIRLVCLLVNIGMSDWGEKAFLQIAERTTLRRNRAIASAVAPGLRPDASCWKKPYVPSITLTSCEEIAFPVQACGDGVYGAISHTLVLGMSSDTVSLDFREAN